VKDKAAGAWREEVPRLQEKLRPYQFKLVAYGSREERYAWTCLQQAFHKLAAAKSGRVIGLEDEASTLGRMVVRRWLGVEQVFNALTAASKANGLLGRDGADRVSRWILRGIDKGMERPWPDLADQLPANSQFTPTVGLLEHGVMHMADDPQEFGLDPEGQPWPEPIDFLGEDTPAVPFPSQLLPPVASLFIDDAAERMSVPADMIGIPLLVGGATMLGWESRLQMKARDNWTECACLWGTVVAEPSTLKTPAAQTALTLIYDMQARMYAEWVKACHRWKDEFDGDEKPPKPLQERIITNEATVEALVPLMSPEGNLNPRGLMLHRDELSTRRPCR